MVNNQVRRNARAQRWCLASLSRFLLLSALACFSGEKLSSRDGVLEDERFRRPFAVLGVSMLITSPKYHVMVLRQKDQRKKLENQINSNGGAGHDDRD
jgi:hypothetical protein